MPSWVTSSNPGDGRARRKCVNRRVRLRRAVDSGVSGQKRKQSCSRGMGCSPAASRYSRARAWQRGISSGWFSHSTLGVPRRHIRRAAVQSAGRAASDGRNISCALLCAAGGRLYSDSYDCSTVTGCATSILLPHTPCVYTEIPVIKAIKCRGFRSRGIKIRPYSSTLDQVGPVCRT